MLECSFVRDGTSSAEIVSETKNVHTERTNTRASEPLGHFEAADAYVPADNTSGLRAYECYELRPLAQVYLVHETSNSWRTSTVHSIRLQMVLTFGQMSFNFSFQKVCSVHKQIKSNAF